MNDMLNNSPTSTRTRRRTTGSRARRAAPRTTARGRTLGGIASTGIDNTISGKLQKAGNALHEAARHLKGLF